MDICFYFQVHQPYRAKEFTVFDAGQNQNVNYFNDGGQTDLNNGKVFRKVSRKSYLPTNKLFLELLERHPELRLSFSFSGVALEQMKQYAPEVLETFQKLAATGQVEILAETYYHSLSFFHDKDEFATQVKKHEQLVQNLFGQTPRVLRNTELGYNNKLGKWVDDHGYDGVVAEGWDPILGWRSPNFVYEPLQSENTKLLLKNYKLSDDIAFRFSNQGWDGWPLTTEKYAQWVNSHNANKEENGNIINLFMDYETFGEHQWEDHGIFDFLNNLPNELLKHPDNDFLTPSEVIDKYPAKDKIDVPYIVSWADEERDLSAWKGNDMQKNALDAIYELKHDVLATGNQQLIKDWRLLQTSDHFYYMCTKWFNDGDVHAYFNPYDSPYDAFVTYMNILTDLRLRIQNHSQNSETQQEASPENEPILEKRKLKVN